MGFRMAVTAQNCGNPEILQFPANLPVADFFCPRCNDQYELKSQKKPFGEKLANGAYSTKIERLKSASNPNLLLLSYDFDNASVKDICIVPKHFFVPEIVEQRNSPWLRQPAALAGSDQTYCWGKFPESGRIHVVQNGILVPRENVLERWRQTLFLRALPANARGWLIEVMKCVETFGAREFEIDDIYAFE